MYTINCVGEWLMCGEHGEIGVVDFGVKPLTPNTNLLKSICLLYPADFLN